MKSEDRQKDESTCVLYGLVLYVALKEVTVGVSQQRSQTMEGLWSGGDSCGCVMCLFYLLVR